MRTDRTGRSARAGFSLIEMVVVIAIMAIVAGAAVPVTSKVLTYQARKATRGELQLLSDAASEFFRDTRRLPTDLEQLLVDPGDAGWSGPYLPGVVTDQITGLTGYQVDAWSRPYQLQANGDVLTLTSMGEDATAGTPVDLEIDLSVAWIRREITLERLETINQSITQYNGQYLATDPLPADWPQALGKLVNRGFLPAAAGYDVDGWEAAFVEVPQGRLPVVKVESANLAGATGTSGGGSSGGKKKKPGRRKKRKKRARPKKSKK